MFITISDIYTIIICLHMQRKLYLCWAKHAFMNFLQLFTKQQKKQQKNRKKTLMQC